MFSLRKLLCKLSAVFLPMYPSACAVLVSFCYSCVSVCSSVLEPNPMLRGCDLGWRWCTVRLITQSPTWLMVDSLHLCPAPPQDTPVWSCHVRFNLTTYFGLNWSLLIVFHLCFILICNCHFVICKGGVVHVKTFFLVWFTSYGSGVCTNVLLVSLKQS